MRMQVLGLKYRLGGIGLEGIRHIPKEAGGMRSTRDRAPDTLAKIAGRPIRLTVRNNPILLFPEWFHTPSVYYPYVKDELNYKLILYVGPRGPSGVGLRGLGEVNRKVMTPQAVCFAGIGRGGEKRHCASASLPDRLTPR